MEIPWGLYVLSMPKEEYNPHFWRISETWPGTSIPGTITVSGKGICKIRLVRKDFETKNTSLQMYNADQRSGLCWRSPV